MYSFYLKKKTNPKPTCSNLMLLYQCVHSVSRNLGAFFWNYLLCKLRLWLCVMMSPMTERNKIVHAKNKRAQPVQNLPVKAWLENVTGAVLSHRFYAMSFHLFFCSWDKRIKLFDSFTCSVLLQTAAEQLCLRLVCCGLEMPFLSKDVC